MDITLYNKLQALTVTYMHLCIIIVWWS